MSEPRHRVVLLAGPSGSGKSRLARQSGLPMVNLDEFYRADTDPSMPRLPGGLIDWDDPRSWQQDLAADTLERLCRSGSASMPSYDMTVNAPIGEYRLELSDEPCVIAEGIFAGELAADLKRRGVLAHALCVQRPRLLTMILRFVRDVREARKPIPVLLTRGWRLMRAEPAVISRLVGQGFTPASHRTIQRLLAELSGLSRP